MGNESNEETELVHEGQAADAATRRIDPADPTRPAAPDAATRQPTAASDPEADTVLPESVTQPAHPGAPTTPPPATRRLEPTRPVEPATGDRETEGPDLSGRLLLSRYRIGDRIGAGGFGSVYRATDELKRSTGEDADLAIKVMDAAQLKGNMSVIVQEVSRSHQVSHPNIVRVHDIHVDGDIAFMTMEMLSGEPLSERIGRALLDARTPGEPMIPFEEMDALTEQVCAGLQHCHDHGLVHADIKPPNVFLCDDGTVKILDLGIAQIAGSRSKVSGYSARYASAQQMSGAKAHPKDDLFSLGCMLFVCLSGDHPFDGQSAKQAQSAGARPNFEHVPRRYRRALEAALQFEQEERIESAAALWHAVSPAVRRRRAIGFGLGAAAAAGIAAASLIGQSIGEEGIAVSEADQAAAQDRLSIADGIAAQDPAQAAAALADALELNPYLEAAATRMVGVLDTTAPTNPAAYSLVWADFGRAIVAAPRSEALGDAVRDHVDRLLAVDPSGIRRSRILGEFRAPLCVLPTAGDRAEELRALSETLKVRC